MVAPAAAATQDHGRLKALFNAVCDLPDRAAQRALLCEQGADADLQAAVLALLGHADRTTHFAAPVAATARQWLGSELKPGDRLGAWTLQRVLGQGGMGRVFLAARSDGHYEQAAAIKLLLGWSGADALARLAHERQILARLQHPHIARLLDGGTTPGGQPYLVMEFADGLAIDAFCEHRHLGLAARLGLLQMVCEAVAAAHRQLIIHCDIKPSNVLVNGDGQAMLLDFGIARLEGEGGAAVAMTPGFASPEQCAGQPPGIASDVYSLGRLLDVLVQPLAGSHRRGRELAAIVACATAPAPAQRYGSVGALQRDLRRLLQHRPLAALPATLGYGLGKLLRRRWPWALAGAGALALSAGFTVGLVQQRDRAQLAGAAAARSRDLAVLAERRARMEAATARETSRFLMTLFTGGDPALMGLPDLPKSLPLDKGRERLSQAMDSDPATRARLQMVLGDVYERIKRPTESLAAFSEAATLFASPAINQPLAEADALRRLALAHNNSGQIELGEAPARRALALRQRHDPGNLADIADAENRLGIVMINLRRYPEAAQLIEHALQLRIQAKGADDPDSSATLHNLARLNRARGDLVTAEAQLRASLAAKARTLPPLDERRLVSLEALAQVLSAQQRHAEAERLAREAVAGWTTVFGAENGNVGIARQTLARVLGETGRLDAALAENTEAQRLEALGGGGPGVRAALMQMDRATLLAHAGRLSEAEQAWRGAVRLLLATEGAPALTVAAARHGLAHTLWRAGRWADATTALAPALALRLARLPAGNDERLASQLLAAELAVAAGDAPRSAQLIAAISGELPAAFPALRLDLLALRGRAAARASRPAEAAAWLTKAWQGQWDWRGGPHPGQLALGLDLRAALQASGQAAGLQRLAPQLLACQPEPAPAPAVAPRRRLAQAQRGRRRRLNSATTPPPASSSA